MGRWIGIDLGTTNSVVAVVDGAHTRILDNMEAKPQTPSAVALRSRKARDGQDRSEILVGDPALAIRPLAPAQTVVSIKRLMGRGLADPEVERVRRWAQYEIVEPSEGTSESLRVVLGAKQYSPVEISALILTKLKDDAEFRLGADEKVTHAVVTVPAYFSQIQRHATRQACLRAGMKVIKILDEPTAAAVAFGMDSDSDTSQPRTIVVYDLGGGTFDISVLMMAGGVFAPLKLQGDMWLGGDDFDQVIVDEALRWIRAEHGAGVTFSPRFMVELKTAAQRVKEQLSGARSADLIIPGLLEDSNRNLIDVEIEFTREWLDDKVRPLVDRTLDLVRLAIEKANLTVDEIDHVLVAGNSTGSPLVQRALVGLFGAERILHSVHPKHCVAIGAALVAARIGGKIVCQTPIASRPTEECGHVNEPDATVCGGCGAALEPVTVTGEVEEEPFVIGAPAPFAYGAQTAGDQYTIFIEDGEPYPTDAPRAHDFFTRVPDQRMISVPVYGGDDRERASANEKQGEAFALLPPGLPVGTTVRVKLWLDADGVFKLSAHLSDGTNLHPWSVTKGETLDRAIKGLEKVEETLGQKAASLAPVERKRIDEARDGIFQRMRAGQMEEALDEISQLGQVAGDAGRGDEMEELLQQAQGLCGYAQHLIAQLGWGLEQGRVAEFETLVQRLAMACRERDQSLVEATFAELNRATDEVPDVVQLLMGMDMAIRARITPVDPELGSRLQRDHAEVLRGLRASDPSAADRISSLAEEVSMAIGTTDQRRSDGVPTCSLGHQVPPGTRFCPSCDEDMWGLRGKTSATMPAT